MKKWETPVIENLKLKDTLETECSCLAVGAREGISLAKDNKHPCHKTGNGQHNNNGNHGNGVDQNGHVVILGCPDPSHYDEAGNPRCCCYGMNVGGQS